MGGFFGSDIGDILGAGITAGANIFNNYKNNKTQKKINQDNLDFANMQFIEQQNLNRNSNQIQMADMQKAGLNPALSQGAAMSAGSYSSNQVASQSDISPIASIMSSVLQYRLGKYQANLEAKTSRDNNEDNNKTQEKIASESNAQSQTNAEISADASKYSSDTSAAASKYSSDTSAAASKYSSDTSAAASKYSSDTSAKIASDNLKENARQFTETQKENNYRYDKETAERLEQVKRDFVQAEPDIRQKLADYYHAVTNGKSSGGLAQWFYDRGLDAFKGIAGLISKTENQQQFVDRAYRLMSKSFYENLSSYSIRR